MQLQDKQLKVINAKYSQDKVYGAVVVKVPMSRYNLVLGGMFHNLRSKISTKH